MSQVRRIVMGGNLKPLSVNRGSRFDNIPTNATTDNDLSQNTHGSDSYQKQLENPNKPMIVDDNSLAELEIDDYLLEKVAKCAAWLRSLQPIQVKPDLAINLEMFQTASQLRVYKRWFLESIKPHMHEPDVVVPELLIGYGLNPLDFTQEQKNRFWQYMELTNELLSLPKSKTSSSRKRPHEGA